MARYPLWSVEEEIQLVRRFENISKYPTKGSITKDFPNRSVQGVQIHLRKMQKEGTLRSFVERVPKPPKKPKVQKPQRKVLFRKGSQVALPFVPSLSRDSSDYEVGFIYA